MNDFWPACGWAQLERDANAWLRPTAAYFDLTLQRPELALVDESCRFERALHRALRADPLRAVAAPELAAIADADARENYRLFLRWRDGLLAAGTLEAWTLQLFRRGEIDIPPLFITWVVQAIVRQLLDDSQDAYEVRAAEFLFRTQRVTLLEGRLLAGDQETLDLQNQTQGFGELGRLLAEAKIAPRALKLQVLGDEILQDFWSDAVGSHRRGSYLLDLTHHIERDAGHGLQLQMTRRHSGLKALAGVLRKWVRHLLGVEVRIEPVQRITDAQWRWHVGLDTEASALLNDLYEGLEVAPDRMQRLVSLFKLEFENPAEMRRDVAGKPVYLGLMSKPDQTLVLKPQNLLLNLPLARDS